jgi:hypothetical protein
MDFRKKYTDSKTEEEVSSLKKEQDVLHHGLGQVLEINH